MALHLVICCSEGSPRTHVESVAPTHDANRTEIDFTDTLAKLFRLLNDYAPPYSQRRYQRTQDVFRRLGRL